MRVDDEPPTILKPNGDKRPPEHITEKLIVACRIRWGAVVVGECS